MMWYRFSKKKYDSAIVALCFSPKEISSLKIKHNLSKKEIVPKDEYHVTMMYLGELKNLKKDKSHIEKALEKLAEKHKPFDLKLGGITKFFSDKDKNPFVFTVNAPEVEVLRNAILDCMDKLNIIEPEDSPSFIPHMTLAYSEPFDVNDIELTNDTLKVKGIYLSWGGDLKLFKFN